MSRRVVARAGTGLAVGALLTAPLVGILTLGSLAKIPPVPFKVFDWLIRVLPGRVVTFGLDLTVGALDGLGFNIKDTAKTAEQVLAVVLLFVTGVIVGLLFFSLVRTAEDLRIKRYGLVVGGVVGLFSVVITLMQGVPVSVAGKVGFVIWVLGLFVLWGWGIARLRVATFPATGGVSVEAGSDMSPRAEVQVISRRRFIIQMGGTVATIIVAGAGVAAVLRAEARHETAGPVETPRTFPNEDSPVTPAPGTRPEYTPVEDHFQVDINLQPPQIDQTVWRLTVDGLVKTPLTLTLDQIKHDYDSADEFVTLSCISNMLGGPLIGTTLWTGVPLRDVLARAGPTAEARWAHIWSADGFDEEVDLELVNDDPRVMLAYGWDGQPLPVKHGFPLRVCVPDRYGMKQPKWITGITLTADSRPGYWVTRNWEERAEIKTTSVIDTVAVKSLVTRDGQTYVPIGGIAHAGAKGISKVEIQVDEGPWQAAQLREPLSEMTWVIWRYDWLYSEGTHWFAVRAYDGQGRLQITEETVSTFGTAVTGVEKQYLTFPPIEP